MKTLVTRVALGMFAIAALGLCLRVSAESLSSSEIDVAQIGSIGHEEGDPRTVFGHIVGVAEDARTGAVYILDRLNARLSAFNRTGKFLAATGRPGNGPGEFQSPLALSAAGPTVSVLDVLNLRISSFNFNVNRFTRVGETSYSLLASGMCLLNHKAYLLGYHSGRIVQLLDAGGQVKTSFGEPFRKGDRMFEELTSQGEIVCDSVSQSVYIAAISTAVARRYTADGKLIWQTSIPGMVPSEITRTPSGVSFKVPRNRENPDAIVSLVVGPQSTVLVQYGVARRGARSLEEITAVTTVILDQRTGKVRGISRKLPRLDSSTAKYAYSHASLPFPRVVIYRWR